MVAFCMNRVSSGVIIIFAALSSFSVGQNTCPKQKVLLHNVSPQYYLDKGERIEVWAKMIPEAWQDNRLIGGVSDPSLLLFNMTSVQASTTFKGVITRNVTAAITSKPNINQSRASHKSEFFIQAFSEDASCEALRVATNISIGCPLYRHIQPRRLTFLGCNELLSRSQVVNTSFEVCKLKRHIRMF
ncbi:uncharacterized protein LOC5505058 isoform X1 [Nematostella vectensis]|uniref:uncharacterized protein LOC5505058 isoform X1 n=1 Tax=Nematostella vectensis TaxID=45351 RepID=UPI002076E8F0|nr:uncharacterized protein LOC5505058 isoform X1 [Nematostella vectensis]